MKMSNEAMATMAEFMAKLDEKGKLGYVIAYNMRKLSEESKEYIDLRNKLLQEYGKQSDDGKSVTVDGENYKKFMDELGDIPQIEHEVNIMKVTPEELYSGTLTSSQMANLMWMVEDTEGEK